MHVSLSALTGQGMPLLHDLLLEMAGWEGQSEDVVLARERHLAAINEAAERLSEAMGQLDHIELCAEELRLAQVALSRIVGTFSADDLLGEIFSRFCIGK